MSIRITNVNVVSVPTTLNIRLQPMLQGSGEHPIIGISSNMEFEDLQSVFTRAVGSFGDELEYTQACRQMVEAAWSCILDSCRGSDNAIVDPYKSYVTVDGSSVRVYYLTYTIDRMNYVARPTSDMMSPPSDELRAIDVILEPLL